MGSNPKVGYFEARNIRDKAQLDRFWLNGKNALACMQAWHGTARHGMAWLIYNFEKWQTEIVEKVFKTCVFAYFNC